MSNSNVEQQAGALRGHFNAYNLLSTQPFQGFNAELMDAIKDAIRLGIFSLTALLRLPMGFVQAVLEAMAGEEKSGYRGITATVTLANISDASVHYTHRARPVRVEGIPGNSTITAGGKPIQEYEREYAEVTAGEQVTVPVTKAVTLLRRHSDEVYPKRQKRKAKPLLKDQLRELSGVLTIDGEAYSWSIARPTPTPAAAPTETAEPVHKVARKAKAAE